MTDIAQVGISVDTKDVKVAAGELNKLANAADDAGEQLGDLGNEAAAAGKKVGSGLGKPVTKATDNVKKHAREANKAGKSTGRFGQIAGQAGFQIGDFATQVQGGQDKLLAFSQQGSQLLGAFGAGGAIAGAVLAVGAAVGGIFLKSTKEANKAIEEFISNIDELQEKADELKLSDAEISLASGSVFDQLKESKKQTEEYEKQLEKVNASIKLQDESINKQRLAGVTQNKINTSLDVQDKNLRKAEELNFLIAKEKEKQLQLEQLRLSISNADQEQLNKILGAEDKRTEMAFRHAAQTKLANDQLADFFRETQSHYDKQEKADQKALENLRKIIEKNKELDDLLDERFAREDADKKDKNDDFLSGILNKNKSEIEVLEGHLQTVKALENNFFADQVMQKEALAVLEGQIEEKKTAKALEEAQKRREMISEGFNDARDIMQAFTDFSLIDSVGRKANLENELRTNKSLSAEQVKNKEQELKGIFEQEKSARKNSILMNTAAGVVNQLATGNWVGAAKVGAAGALNYAKVAATTFKSPAPAPAATSSDGGGQAQAGANITFDFQNVPAGSMVSSDGLVEMMKESLRDARRNGEII